MNDFTSESSIGGVVVFHSSEPKKARIGWLFVYFLFFILLGYYVFFIYTRYKLEPEFSYKFSEFPLQEVPFPAVTVCSPLFARNQSVNLRKFLKNLTKHLTAEQQNLLAANVQACAPELGPKIDQFCPLADTQKTIGALKSKFLNVNDAFAKVSGPNGCAYSFFYVLCSNVFNYVLTDFGFCFTYNLEAFSTLFNTEVISDDFQSYSRHGKISKNYYNYHPEHRLRINETNQPIDWNLEKGYLTNSSDTLPIRAFYKKGFSFISIVNALDVTNLCPEIGRNILLFFHMPNEILTPFHKTNVISRSVNLYLKAKLYKVDESLRPFPPKKRNCYFEGERKLKFFKSYTKAHCQFECLANFTLAQCGCVKFSMPRENSTRICGLNETSCYIQVAKNWNLTCDCLHPCTYIEYEIDQTLFYIKRKFDYIIFDIRINFENIFGAFFETYGIYDFYQGFADFGGMLGTLFGASLISLIEIVYFIVLRFMKTKVNIQDRNDKNQVSEFASSSTIHGVQFIFDKSRHKLVRIFWIFSFIFAFFCCIYNSRESYWKLNVVPEMESTNNLKSIEEIPFPAITICSPIFVKGNLTVGYFEFNSKYDKRNSIIKDLSEDQYFYLIANYYWSSPNIPFLYIRARKLYFENITVNPENHRSEVDLFPYLYRSHLEVDDLFSECMFQGKSYQCSKIFKKIMTARGICYSFNLQNHHQIFTKQISKNFDSYGKFHEHQETQWSLDKGYFLNATNPYPVRASKQDTFEFKMEVPISFTNRDLTRFFINSPNDLLMHISPYNLMYLGTQVFIKFSAKSKRTDENLRKFTPENRGCYFEDEKKLQFFKSYTRSNCMLECFTNYTLKSCGCVVYLLPHNNQTIICDSSNEAKCYGDSLKYFPPANDSLIPCGCLPTCNDIEYSFEKEKNTIKRVSKTVDTLHLKFQYSNNSEFSEEEIHVAFGPRDFLTNVGGFLGLYLGCSVISIFEIFYFLPKFLHDKLAKRRVTVDEEIVQKLNLAQIFDLDFTFHGL